MFERASLHTELPQGSRRFSRRAVGAAMATSLLASVIVIGPVAPVAFAAPLITGTVTNDANANGTIDNALGTGAEVGLGGVIIELLDSGGNSIDPDGGGPLTQTLTTTAANGSYSLDAQADGTYIVRVTAPDGYIINPVVNGGAGDITRTSTNIGDSDPIVLSGLDAVVDPLVRPDFEMQIGYLNNPDGIITGAAPFDTSDASCTPVAPIPVVPTILNDTTTPAGVDCTPYDDNVRSADNVAFNFAISGSAIDDTVDEISDVVVQQTITPAGGAIINFARIPIACVPPSGGSGGTPPPTSVVEYWNGSTWVNYTGPGYTVPQTLPPAAIGQPLRLTCNKGTYATGDASTLGTTVRVDGESPNGSTFQSEAIVFAVDSALNAFAVAAGPLDAPEIEIKARPEWDLRKGGFYRQDWTTHDPDGGGPLPSTAGFFTYFNIMIGSDRKAGNEPLQQPLVLQDQMYFFRGDGTTPVSLTLGTDYFLGDCRDFWPQSLGNYSSNVISDPTLVSSPYTANMSVQESGTCTVNGTTGQITWSGIDFGGPYPTVTNTNQSLAAGPYLVANKWLRVWVPYSTLDNLFGDAANNDAGSGFFWNRVTGFDPNGVSGNSNYGASNEPGWCNPASTPTAADTGCDVLPAADLLTGVTHSNDVAGPTSFTFSPGYYSKYLLKPNGNDRSWVRHDDMTDAHTGDGTIQPNQYTSTWLHWLSQSSTYENPEQCDIWDNTMYKLVPLAEANVGSNSGASSSLYATSTGAGTNPGFLTYEFANIPITGDDPLGPFNGATGRFDGTWTDQRSSNCDEPGATWFTDPNDVPGGIDNVNAVRVTGRSSGQTVGDTPTMFPGQDRLLRVGLLARDTFYGGPNDGEAIPSGAVGANYGKIKSSNRSTGAGIGVYNNPSYIPAPENASTDGDRLTWTRAVLGIKKRTIALDGLCAAPCAAAIDVNGSVLAGQPIVWEMLPVVNASSPTPAPVPDVIVTDVLPVYVDYDAACTALLTGGTPADDVQINTPGPGQTTLIWYLGSVTPNEALPPLRICTGTDPLAPAPTSVTNRVDMDSVAIPTSHPFDTHTLTLEQSGDLKLRKTVDAPLDVLNDDQVWTVSYANFSETVAVQPIRTIEVFPYNGDATPPGGPTRTPTSSFSGALELTAVIDPKYADGTDVPGTAYYSADAPNTINQDWNLNTSTWCSSTDGVTFTLVYGAGPCPVDLSEVTAWMFEESSPLVPVSNPNKNRVNIPFTLQAGDPLDPLSPTVNEPGDRYTNRFTAFSNTFVSGGVPQRLSSNTVRVRTLGFSAGDFVWDDRDGDGLYTDGVDLPVPDGVTINLYYVPAVGPAVLFDSTTTTDGTYLFTDLPEGDFYIEIPAGEFGVGELLEGWEITSAPAADPDDVEQDDDVSHDAIPGTGAAVISHTFTLSATVNGLTGAISGDEPTADNLHGITDPTLVTDGFNNFTIDLALRSPLVSIGDTVWLDVDRDGLQGDVVDEPGIENVIVELLDAAGNSIDPDGAGPETQTLTTTDGDGFYSFTGLVYSTDYQVLFTLPNGYEFTQQFAGGTTIDSNADEGTGIADVITPADGANSSTEPDEDTIDAGMVNVDLTITKVLDPDPNYYPGKVVTYTITPSNLGLTDALAGWSVTEVPPAGLTDVSIVGDGGPSTYTCVGLTCTSSVPLGAEASAETLTVTATIADDYAGAVRNVVYISPADDEVDESNPLAVPPVDTDTDTTTTNNDDHADLTSDIYDLALAKTADATSVSFGDTVTFTLVIANQGTVASGSYTVVDVVPAGLTVDESSITDGGVWASGPRTITWSLSGLAATNPDTTVSVSYDVEVTDLGGRPWRNFAEIATDGGTPWGGDNDSTPDTNTTNDGDYDESGVDNTSIAGAGVGDDPEDDADVANLTNDDVYDLALAKVANVTAVDNVGDPITFSITVANQGTLASGEFTVVDEIPVGLTAPTSISNGGLWASGPRTITWVIADLAVGAELELTYDSTVDAVGLPAAPWQNFAEITADSATDYGPTFEDTDSTPGGGTPSEGTDNTGPDAIDQAGVDGDADYDDQDIAVVTSGAVYDLALAKTNTVTGSGEETVIDYEITIENQGTLSSNEFTVVDQVPAGLVPDSVDDGGVYDDIDGTITWVIDDLAPGDSITVGWSATVEDFTLRPFRNFAEITEDGASDYGPLFTDLDSVPDDDTTNDGDYDEPGVDNETIDEAGEGTDPEDDADISDAEIEINYDLALAKAPSATTINPDGTVTFTLTVENQGDVNSGAYTIVDTLPAGLSADSASDSGVISGSTVTWELDDLAPGATRSVTVVVSISDITLRPFKNVAEITSNGADEYDAENGDVPGADVEDSDSVTDSDPTNDNMSIDDGYGTFENPTNDIDDIADVDSVPNGDDDADVAFFDVPVLYDLALVKTGPATFNGNDPATFTIEIANQGNVPSGEFTVEDIIPMGLVATAASNGGVISGQTVTWTLSGLAPGATTTVTVTVVIDDFTTRPWVNAVEITSDSSDDYDSEGYENEEDGDVSDDDSTPDDNTENDVVVDQDTLPTDQFNDPSVDEDDHDIAPIDADIDYDLALVKVLPANQSFKKGNPVVFNILVKNQGNVDSGPVTVQDLIPAGLLFVSATAGGLSVGQVVTWEIANLTPGQVATLSVTVTVDNTTLASYVNQAEIVADGSAAYSTDGDIVTDADSTPDTNLTNDLLVDTDDVNIDQIPGDEDDHDRALLDPAKVKSDNPRGGGIPATGSNTMPLLYGAAVVFGLGALALLITRRRRGQLA